MRAATKSHPAAEQATTKATVDAVFMTLAPGRRNAAPALGNVRLSAWVAEIGERVEEVLARIGDVIGLERGDFGVVVRG